MYDYLMNLGKFDVVAIMGFLILLIGLNIKQIIKIMDSRDDSCYAFMKFISNFFSIAISIILFIGFPVNITMYHKEISIEKYESLLNKKVYVVEEMKDGKITDGEYQKITLRMESENWQKIKDQLKSQQ